MDRWFVWLITQAFAQLFVQERRVSESGAAAGGRPIHAGDPNSSGD